MKESNLLVRIERDFTKDGYNMWVLEKRDGEIFTANPVEMIFSKVMDYEPGFRFDRTKPFLRLSGVYGQAWMDSLARELSYLGYIQKSDEEVVKAIRYHLEDMRSLVKGVKT